MTVQPVKVQFGSPMTEAVTLMAKRKISELPVVDSDGRPAGLIDVTDVVGLLPREEPPVAVRPDRPAASGCRLFPDPEGESMIKPL